MTWYPKYNLYASDGLTLVYPFEFILSDNSPQDQYNYTEITGFRGQGSFIINGAVQPWDLELTFFLNQKGYENIIAAMDSLQTTVAFNTSYVLKIDRTISTTQNYNVKRILPIQWADTKRVNYQKGVITFRVNSW